MPLSLPCQGIKTQSFLIFCTQFESERNQIKKEDLHTL
jgi:hypothetical protein